MRRIACLVLLVSCAPKHAKPEAVASAAGNEPEAVASAAANEPVKLTYAIDAFVGNWKMESRFKARPNSPSFEVTAEFVMRFAKASPDALDVFLERLAIHGTAGTKPVESTMDASDPKFAELMKTPLHRIVMHADGPGEAMPNVDNPLSRQGAHLINSALFLIPSLPIGPVAHEAKWTTNRVVPKSNSTSPEVKAEIHYGLVRFEPCGKARCAVLASTADTGERTTEVNGAAGRVRYTLEGTSQIQLNGALVKSDVKMTMLIRSNALTFDADGTLTCQRL